MRRFAWLVVLVVPLLVVACSSGAAQTASPDNGGPGESQAPPSAEPSAPAESAPAESAAPSAEPTVDESIFGEDYARIQEDLQERLAEITASMGTATTPEAIAKVYSDYADAMRDSIAATRAIDWPAPIRGDIDTLLDFQEELAGLYDNFITDPAAIDQDRLAQISEEIPAVVQRIAAYFGVTVTP
jgi:hypothetical protein